MIADDQAMITGECADDTGFDLLDGTDIQQRAKVCRWNGQHHTLLRFREPDFPGGQSLIFEWGTFKFDASAGLRRHLANRRGETASAAVGDGRVELAVTRLDNHVGHLFFRDRRANLHSASGPCIDLAAHLARGEGCAVDAIAAGTTAQHNDAVTWLYMARMAAMREDAQAATEDKRILNIPFVPNPPPVPDGLPQPFP